MSSLLALSLKEFTHGRGGGPGDTVWGLLETLAWDSPRVLGSWPLHVAAGVS